MKLDGHIFKRGAGIIQEVGGEDEDIHIGIIGHVYVVNGGTVLFQTDLYEAEYHSKFRVFTLRSLNKVTVISHDSLPVYIPLHPRTCRILPRELCVIMPFYLV